MQFVTEVQSHVAKMVAIAGLCGNKMDLFAMESGCLLKEDAIEFEKLTSSLDVLSGKLITSGKIIFHVLTSIQTFNSSSFPLKMCFHP